MDSVTNGSMDLAQCRDAWTYNEKYNCWCLENVLYTAKANVPQFQQLSIFAPKAYLNPDGTINPEGKSGPYTARMAPVVFENNAAGYLQMPHTWLDGPRCYAGQYLERGMIYVTCGCRGRDSRDAEGRLVGKSPITLVDLKTALRFLRHNRAVLPGDWDKIISVGWSAGGAMSSLLAVSGDNAAFDAYLEANGAFLEESDSVFAAQIYCPIVDLEHADLAYEWMFQADKTCEDSPAGPAETMTPFKEALSAELSRLYVSYFNCLGLFDPETGKALTLNVDGRSGSGYDYLMKCLNASATDYLTRLSSGKLPETYSVQDYLTGNYTYEVPMPRSNADSHHAGPGKALPEQRTSMSLGQLQSRPPQGVSYPAEKRPMMTVSGTDKQEWLTWDGKHACISDLDSYVLRHRGRMKPCTSFDKLEMNSGENQEFGTEREDYVHFDPAVADALEVLKNQFPAEYAQYHDIFAAVDVDEALAQRIRLINPLSFIGTGELSHQAKHFRIRVGARDADTSLSISMTLALKLSNAGCGTVDYAMVWDKPHCEADYPGEVCDWIDRISR